MYYSVVKVKYNRRLEFFKIKLQSSICIYASINSDMLNKNTWGVKKSARPIRSNIANRQVRPKGLISAEAKKLLYQNTFIDTP